MSTTKTLRKDLPEYRVWKSMIARCHIPSATGYKFYGGRGVQVCVAWRRSFEAFFDDMGPRPSDKHELDRIDTYGDYTPDNCRWLVGEENRRCDRRSYWWCVDDHRFNSSAVAAKHFGVNQSTIHRWCLGRVEKGVQIRPPKKGCYATKQHKKPRTLK